MITFCKNKYSAKRDKYQWVLTEYREGRSKKDANETKIQSKDIYHATLQQVCQFVIDKEAGQCEDVTQLKQMLIDAVESMIDAVSEKPETVNFF